MSTPPVAPGPGAAQVEPAEADPLDALLVEPREPGVVATGVVLARLEAGVLEPELDVRRGVEDLALHDERVDSSVVVAPQRGAIVTSMRIGARELFYLQAATLDAVRPADHANKQKKFALPS